MLAWSAPLLLSILLLATALGGLAPLPADDDAGSGADAPEGPAGAPVVEAGIGYSGGILHPDDDADAYALQGAEAGRFVLRVTPTAPVCVQILADGARVDGTHCFPEPVEYTGTYELPAAQAYHLRFVRVGSTTVSVPNVGDASPLTPAPSYAFSYDA